MFFMAYNVYATTLDNNNQNCIIDFSYPVSQVESARQDIAQALYFLQDGTYQDVDKALNLIESGSDKLNTRIVLDPDDRDYLQAMIDKINSLINALENDDQRSYLASLSSQLQNQF